MALEYRLAKLVHFALHQYVGAGAFEGKVETADAGEERDHADGRLAAGATQTSTVRSNDEWSILFMFWTVR